MLLFSLGAIWTAGLSLILRPLFRAAHLDQVSPMLEVTAQTPKYAADVLLRRWRRSLAHLTGWQYTLRITSCLAAAQAVEYLWPHSHGYWMSLTVAIVIQRDLSASLMRTLQRAAGTVLGVLLAGLLMIAYPSVWSMILMIAVLAAARPILREANYAAYAAVMTPLIILLLEFSKEPSPAVVLYRLAATLIGCILALTLGYLLWSGPRFRSQTGGEDRGAQGKSGHEDGE
ncbi:MAG: FUSC family protein [Syntrophales bacterium]|nr:FUSC family protein [Syntrophales bacterium]